jgi:predicted ATPase/DNA-binding winged helix-turn-helix (wHTH) protein
LWEDDKPVRLGSRAIDLLIELVTHAGEIISNKDIFARVWPTTVVDEINLRVHIAAVRRALGDDRAQRRYIVNVPGRGYSFVEEVTAGGPGPAAPDSPGEPLQDLPMALTRIVGRSETIASLIEELKSYRQITIVGPGGIGKTRLALAVAESSSSSYAHGVCFADLSTIGDGQLLPGAVASALALTSIPPDPVAAIIEFLRHRQMLVILDSCEHVLTEAAALAQRVLQRVRGIRILATSREPLKIGGERVRRVRPLGVPPASSEISADSALTFPAVELFVERAAAILESYTLDDRDAPVVAEICRKLDGIPLAIELFAGQVETFGISGLVEMLKDRFALYAEGGSTTVARHRTMNATLDWSYGRLSDPERAMLRRLSVFAGAFTLDAVQAAIADVEPPGPAVAECLASLVSKSLVTADIFGPDVTYRLLDTTRSYAFAKLMESGELNATARRHATYYREYLDRTAGDARKIDEPAAYRDLLSNLRVALNWAFSENGDTQIATALAAASGPFFIQMSLLGECSAWTGRAIAVLDDTTRGGHLELELQSSHGFALAYTTRSTKGAALEALGRALQLALALRDHHRQIRLLAENLNLLIREGHFGAALTLAQKSEPIARMGAESNDLVKMDWMLGTVHHMVGDQISARLRYEAVVKRLATAHAAIATGIDIVDSRIHALGTLARISWLEGYADQSVARIAGAVEEATILGHPLTLCVTLMSAASIYLWVGDLGLANETLESNIAAAEKYSFAPVLINGRVEQAKLAILSGEIDAGVSALQAFLEPSNPYRDQWHNIFGSVFVRGLASQGRIQEALTLIESFIAEVELNGGSMYLPDLLRAKGDVLADAPGDLSLEAEAWLLQSLECARSQSVLAFELQAALSLARLWLRNSRSREAKALLEPIYLRFTEGFNTADLRTAKAMLDQLK